MNATKRSAARAGFVVCGVLAVALTGCRTHVVHEHTRTVYVPAPPPPIVNLPAPQLPPPVVVVPPPEQPPVVVIQSENDFYEPLAAHGRWVMVGTYGRCWIPARVEVGWRPYSNGYWQRTDAGWYWASEEPWGWATYHYGRWDFHAQYGWVWVPQTQWAPAWVSWREGGGYVGWAPLRPSVTIGVSVGAVNYEPAFASRAFVFVEHRRMLEPIRPRTVIVNNTTIINKTVNITNVRVVNKTVINEGPRPEVIERESGRKVQSVPVREFRRREEATVTARQRNVPTAPERKVEAPARTEPRRVEERAILPPVARQAEKPSEAVVQPQRPTTTARPELRKPAGGEQERATEIGRKAPTTSPRVQPGPRPEVKPEQAAPSRPQLRPRENAAVATKPTPRPVTTIQVRDEEKREIKSTATPRLVEPKSRNELRPEPKPETNPPVRVVTSPRPAVKKQDAPALEKPADKQLISPREIPRAAERSQPAMKREDNNPKKKGEDQEPPSRVAPTRPSR